MASSSLRRSVLVNYKALLSTINSKFSGDAMALAKTREAARAAVLANALEVDTEKIAKMVDDMREAKEFIEMHIAQAKLNEAGRYELGLQPSYAENDAINIQGAKEAADGKTKSSDGGCCGGGCA